MSLYNPFDILCYVMICHILLKSLYHVIYIYMCMCISFCTCVCMYVRMHACMNGDMHVCMCACVPVCMHVYTLYTHLYINICIYTYIYVYICMYKYIYIYICTINVCACVKNEHQHALQLMLMVSYFYASLTWPPAVEHRAVCRGLRQQPSPVPGCPPQAQHNCRASFVLIAQLVPAFQSVRSSKVLSNFMRVQRRWCNFSSSSQTINPIISLLIDSFYYMNLNPIVPL